MIHTVTNVVRGFLSGDGALILPELELVLFGCGILVIDRWLAANEKHWNALLALAGTAFSGFTLYVQHGKIAALRATNPDSPGLLGFRQSVLVDPFFLFFAVLFLATIALIVLLSVRYREHETKGHGAYYALLLFACVGMMLMVAGVDVLVVLLGLEVMGVSCFLLTSLSRNASPDQRAARNYAFLWACSSFPLVGGFFLLYRQYGATNLGRIGAVLETRLDAGVAFGGLTAWPVWLALVLLAAGTFFLIDAGFFHWFVPGIYDSAAAPVAAFLSAGAKTAGFALLLRFFTFLFVFGQEKWIHVWGAAAIVSLLWGNIAALRERNVQRLLAYGAVAQTGFILLGLVAGNATGFTGMMYSFGVLAFTTIGAFAILILLGPGRGSSVELSDLDGLYRRNRWAAALLLVFMMALAGVPPTAGFVAKYYVVKALLAHPHPELAGFAVVNALLSVYYYGRVAAHAWKRPAAAALAAGEVQPPHEMTAGASTVLTTIEVAALTISSGQAVALTVAVFVSLAAGLYPEPFLRFARYAFGQ